MKLAGLWMDRDDVPTAQATSQQRPASSGATRLMCRESEKLHTNSLLINIHHHFTMGMPRELPAGQSI